MVQCGSESSEPTGNDYDDFSVSSSFQLDTTDVSDATYNTSSSTTSTGTDNSTTNTNQAQSTSTQPLPDNSTFSIHFIDVGQADAALVSCDGHYMLIDGGNKADSSIVYTVLKKSEVSHLDIVVGTHAHEDHIGGIPGAFNYADADLTLCTTTSYDSKAFSDFKKYADLKGGGIVIPSVGDTYTLGSAGIEILGVNSGTDTNDTSILLMITYGETKFLFTGDAEREAEQAILNSGVDLSATVLKVGHHGSDTSTTYPFLREIMPKYAVISVGTGNSYGHPTEDTLSRLRDADVTVYRTDLQGDITCVSDGSTVSFSVSKNASADTLSHVSKSDTTGSITGSTANTSTSQSTTSTTETEAQAIPDGAYYILNTDSKKFHDPDCGTASKIDASNKDYYTGTAEELIAKGYTPCGNCKPYEIQEQKQEQKQEVSSTSGSTSTQTPTQSETMVWIPKSGSKYHSYSGCSNMKNPSQVTKSQAVSRGYTACKKCW